MRCTTARAWFGRGIVIAVALAWVGGVAIGAGVAGDLDTTFDGDGVLLVANDYGSWPSVAMQSSGRMVIGGTEPRPPADGGARSGWRIRRHDSSGGLDTSFGTAGEVLLFGLHGTDDLRHITVDSSDRVLCVGKVRVEVLTGSGKKQKASYPIRFTVVRLLPDGALDTTFGSGGVVHVDLPAAGGGAGRADAVVALTSGAVLACGQAFDVAAASSGGGKGNKGGGSSSTSGAVALVRLTGSGALDTGFGAGGVVVHDVTADDDEPWRGALGVQGTGRIIVGSLARGLGEQWVLTAYSSAGVVDSGFGRVSVGGAFLRGLAIDASDRIVGCGYTAPTPGAPEFVLTRHASDGSIDTSFGTGGSVELGLAESCEGGPILVQADGKIIAGLNVIDGAGEWRCQPVRLTSAGVLDGYFGSGGFGEVVQGTGAYHGLFAGGFVDAAGNLVLAGVRQDALGGTDWLVGRWCGN